MSVIHTQQYFSIISKVIVVHNITMQIGMQLITKLDRPCCFQIKLWSTKTHAKHALCIPAVFQTYFPHKLTQLKNKVFIKDRKCWIAALACSPRNCSKLCWYHRQLCNIWDVRWKDMGITEMSWVYPLHTKCCIHIS